MKKIFAILLILLSLTGCSENTAKSAVESYLNKYKTLSSEVLTDLEKVVEDEGLDTDNANEYRAILKKQYQDLTYEVTEEVLDGDNAFITVKIGVYDLFKAQSDASDYLLNHPDEFIDDNNNYDYNKYVEYKIDQMRKTTNRIEYTLTFTVIKEDDKYIVSQPTENDLKKIHGIYDYELD